MDPDDPNAPIYAPQLMPPAPAPAPGAAPMPPGMAPPRAGAPLSPQLLQQLSALGGYGDETGLIEQQMRQAMALRKPGGEHHTTAGGAIFGGLADALNNVLGAREESQLRGQQKALIGQRAAGRQAALQALNGEPMPENIPADLYTTDEPTLQEKVSAFATALRGQRQGANAMLATGDPVLEKLGQQQLNQAAALQQQLGEVGKVRLQRALEAQRLTEEQHWHQVEAEARQRQLDIQEQALRRPDYAVDPFTGQFYNKRGSAPQAAPPPGSGHPQQSAQPSGGDGADQPIPPIGSRARRQLDAEMGRLGSDISRDQHLNKGLQERLQASERLDAVLYDENGKLKNPALMQWPEIAGAAASLISGGGHPPEQVIHELMPNTSDMKWDQMVQYFSNNPQSPDTAKFAQILADQSKREASTIHKQVLRNQLRAAAKHSQIIHDYPSLAWRTLGSEGITPDMFDEKGAPRADLVGEAAGPGTQRAPAGSFDVGSALPPDKQRRLEELRARRAAGTLK